MNVRVRAILLTPSGGLLLIRRIKPGVPPYWVLPGGKVEAYDADLHAALKREVREETGGEVEIVRRVFVSRDFRGVHHIYLGRIGSWSETDRLMPEGEDPANGEYHLEEIALTLEALDGTRLVPAEIVPLLRQVASGQTDLHDLQDPEP